MTDHHIHIGQFNELYYDAHEVFEIIESLVEKTGIDSLEFSSTSSCRDDVDLEKIEEETAYAQAFSSEQLTTKPYLWFVPRYAEQGIAVESAAQSFDYCGIKLHPAAQTWNLENKKHRNCMEQIFRWADNNQKEILIHCGPKEYDLPTRFEHLIKEHTNARIILAHSNPVQETAYMLNKYSHVYCDVACTIHNSIKKLTKLVQDKKKILFGSDFPVNHYFNTHLFNKTWNLEEEYLKNCTALHLLQQEK